MGFAIQIVPGKAEVRPSYLAYPGAADNAARDGLGAKTAIVIRGTRPNPLPGSRRVGGPLDWPVSDPPRGSGRDEER